MQMQQEFDTNGVQTITGTFSHVGACIWSNSWVKTCDGSGRSAGYHRRSWRFERG